MKAPWYAAYTQPRKELWARSNLWERGLEVYVPMCRKKRRHARRTDWVTAPLFPRYLFVRADLALTGSRVIGAAPGVVNLISYGPRPASVAPSIIDEIRLREDAEGFVPIESRSDYLPGERVQIRGGPFHDYSALFVAESDQRVFVLLDLLGRPAKVRIAKERVAPAAYR